MRSSQVSEGLGPSRDRRGNSKYKGRRWDGLVFAGKQRVVAGMYVGDEV